MAESCTVSVHSSRPFVLFFEWFIGAKSVPANLGGDFADRYVWTLKRQPSMYSVYQNILQNRKYYINSHSYKIIK